MQSSAVLELQVSGNRVNRALRVEPPLDMSFHFPLESIPSEAA
jgi:hypothetical protein